MFVSSVTREGLIAAGVIAPEGFSTISDSAPATAREDRPVSHVSELQSRRAARQAQVQNAQTTAAGSPLAAVGRAPTERQPCALCGSVSWRRCNLRRGQLLCQDCARDVR
jgi:hypothetical protein